MFLNFLSWNNQNLICSQSTAKFSQIVSDFLPIFRRFFLHFVVLFSPLNLGKTLEMNLGKKRSKNRRKTEEKQKGLHPRNSNCRSSALNVLQFPSEQIKKSPELRG